MNEPPADYIPINRDKPHLIVELVGPAGAGKTTLAQALNQCSRNTLISIPPYFRRIEHIPFFARNTLLLSPTLLHLYFTKDGRWLTPKEMAWMVTLKGWHRALGRQASHNGTITLLDQGPVFMLAWLYGFGPKNLRGQSAKKWWSSTSKQWADTLDMVIELDTSDTILLERIRTRGKWHSVKGQSEAEVFEFLAHWRAAYEQVLSALTADGRGPKVFHFDSARQSLDEIVNRVRVLLGFTDYNDKIVV